MTTNYSFLRRNIKVTMDIGHGPMYTTTNVKQQLMAKQ